MAQRLHWNKENENRFTIASQRSDRSNSREMHRKAAFLLKAIDLELTDLQRYCAREFWLNGKLQKDIAEQLGVSCSTVSRHISAAKRNLLRSTQYLE